MKIESQFHTITLSQEEANLILSALYLARADMVRVASQSKDMPNCRKLAFSTYADYQELINQFKYDLGAEA